MTKNDKNQYFNLAMQLKIDMISNGKESFDNNDKIHLDYFPPRLYKYRCFDEYTVDMIRNNYIYLTPAIKLDDQFECRPDYDINKVFNTKTLSKYFIDALLDSLKDYNCSMTRTELKEITKKYINRDKSLNKIKIKKELLKSSNQLNDEYADELVKYFLALASGAWISESNENSLTNILKTIDNLKYNLGIGSLSETNVSQVMWSMYSKNYEGYCIEYDFTSDIDTMINTYPVLYGSKYKTNMIMIIVRMLLDDIIYKLSGGKIKNSDSVKDYTRIFVTKHKEWEFQKEWRLIGDANYKFEVPKIKSIYLGKNVSDNNKSIMIDLCKENKIDLYIQEDNYIDLSLNFKKIL